MKRKLVKLFLILMLIVWGLLLVFAFSYASGQEKTVSQEASYYTEMAMNKMEEAIKAYGGEQIIPVKSCGLKQLNMEKKRFRQTLTI